MTDEFGKLSDLELLSLIHRAQQEIQHRKEAGKEQLRVEIEEKLKTFGLDIDDVFPGVGKKPRKASIGRNNEEERKTQRAKFKNHVGAPENKF